jgi:hypothetical protein
MTDTTTPIVGASEGGTQTVDVAAYEARVVEATKAAESAKAEAAKHAARVEALVGRRKADQIAQHLGDLADPEFASLPSIASALQYDDDGGLTDAAVKALARLRTEKPAYFRPAQATITATVTPPPEGLPPPSGAAALSWDDWKKLYRTNPEEAIRRHGEIRR